MKELIAQVLAHADAMPDFMGPHLFSTFIIGRCSFKVKTASPLLTRQRAKKLEKDARAVRVSNPPRHAKASLKRPKFSKKLAEQFLEDGESKNHIEYCRLYDEPPFILEYLARV